MLVEDKELIDRIEAFNKYARFISQKFGVTVVLDGREAKTDGTIIYLPNLSAVTEDELDFLYCVLLHEVGHVRYSRFSKERMMRIKSDSHFVLYNAVEDARIENLLMREYAGAKDHFDELYHKFSADPRFMDRVFGIKSGRVSALEAVSLYAHYALVDLDKIAFADAVSKSAMDKVNGLKFKSELDKLLSSHKPETPDDALDLADKLYGLFFKDSADNSTPNRIAEQERMTKESIEQLSKLRQELDKKLEELAELRGQARGVRSDISGIEEEKEPFSEELSSLQDKASGIEKKKSPFDRAEYLKESLDGIHKRQEETPAELAELEQKIKESNEKLAEATKAFEKAGEDVKNAVYGDKIASKKRLAGAKRNLKTVDNENNKLSGDLECLKSEVIGNDSREKRIRASLDDAIAEQKNITENPEQLAKDLTSVNEQLNQTHTKTSEFDDKISSRRTDLSSVNRKIKNLQESIATEGMKVANDIQKRCKELGIPSDMIPEIESLPGWEDADAVQKAFDERASKSNNNRPVVNGGFFGTNVRDVMVMLEKGADNLQSIDLGKLFKDRAGKDKLDSFNDMSQVKNIVKDAEAKSRDDSTALGVRRHVPLTTEFDQIKIRTGGSARGLLALRLNNAGLIIKVREEFKKKMNFRKKLRFKGQQEEGRLDDRSIWRLASGSGDDFYEVAINKKMNDVIASIAVDISGSMEKRVVEHETLLKEIVLVLSEGLSSCYIRHEICGFHAPVCDDMLKMPSAGVFNRAKNSLETVVYRGFADRQNSGIDNIEIQCTDNSDGESLRVIGGRLLKERAKRKVLFLITDGKPFLSGSDTEVMDHDLRNAIRMLESRRVEVYPFNVGSGTKELLGGKMFDISKPDDVLVFAKERLL
jgi:predicted  nucleic acid-binding Zn-ribbon protein